MFVTVTLSASINLRLESGCIAPPPPLLHQDEDQVEDSFITDPDKHKQSLLGAAQPMVEVVNSEEIAEEVNYEDEEFEVCSEFYGVSTSVCMCV